MKIVSLPFLLLCVSALTFSGCQTAQPEITYKASAFMEKNSGFSRQSKIVVYVDPEVPIEHRDQMAKVESVAKKAGLSCTVFTDAEYVLVVTTDTFSHPAPGDGYYIFGLKGKAYRLLDGGKKRAARSEWEGSVIGSKGTFSDWQQKLSAPWVDVDTVVQKFVDCIGIEKNEQ